MLQLLEAKEDSTCEIASTFSSLQAEVEAKTRKLKKLYAKLQSIKQETVDVHDEFCTDRADLQQSQDELTRYLSHKYFMSILFYVTLLRCVGSSDDL